MTLLQILLSQIKAPLPNGVTYITQRKSGLIQAHRSLPPLRRMMVEDWSRKYAVMLFRVPTLASDRDTPLEVTTGVREMVYKVTKTWAHPWQANTGCGVHLSGKYELMTYDSTTGRAASHTACIERGEKLPQSVHIYRKLPDSQETGGEVQQVEAGSDKDPVGSATSRWRWRVRPCSGEEVEWFDDPDSAITYAQEQVRTHAIAYEVHKVTETEVAVVIPTVNATTKKFI